MVIPYLPAQFPVRCAMSFLHLANGVFFGGKHAVSSHAPGGDGRCRLRQVHHCGSAFPAAWLGLRRSGRVPPPIQHRQDEPGLSSAGRGPLALAAGNQGLDDRKCGCREEHGTHVLRAQAELPSVALRRAGPGPVHPPRRRGRPDRPAHAGPRWPLHAAHAPAQPAGHPGTADRPRTRRGQPTPGHLQVPGGDRGRRAGWPRASRPGTPSAHLESSAS
ncbi:hypothetical protein AHiyo4_12170 [Arthrobacter sp. Hiyo4]|nr:hypothetical protein AHiyo4_12170 [Arthrobacter sp. Hiyo4]